MDKLKYKDFTLKARLISIKDIESKLVDLKAKFVGQDYQRDQYFEVLNGKLKWRNGTIENIITHYERVMCLGIEKTKVYRYDINPTKEQIQELFSKHSKIILIEKTRKIYMINNIKIHLDTLPNKTTFIEIEAIDRNNKFSNKELKSQCYNIKSQLGIPDKDLIKTGYLNK